MTDADPTPPPFPPQLRERLPRLDPVALESFFDAYFDRVYGYVRRLVNDEQLAEDLTQDVFLHIQRAFSTYDPERELRPWVFTIATNRVRDHWRSHRHREGRKDVSVERDAALLGLSAGEHRPDSDLAENELSAILRDAVDELPEGMRMAVLLRVYEGLSFEAIGEVLDRSEVAVRKRYSRALEALRAALGPAWRVHTEGGS
jgi:RNA polymerase sigma-70 factor (ECF subfamily)